MRLTSTLASAASAFPWLASLKTAQLQSIAQATGIQLSGPKGVLVRRLQRELQQCEYPPPSVTEGSGQGEDGPKAAAAAQEEINNNNNSSAKGKKLSILSIDMGIQNLAFAHLLVPSPGAGGGGSGSSSNKYPVPTLNAWRRLAVSAFSNSSESSASESATSTSTLLDTASSMFQRILESKSKSKSKAKAKDEKASASIEEETAGKEETEAALIQAEPNAATFSPALYASHAYTLITSLIATYRPTHILIERQRFRSGGGAAVQEWTLRVGVFEGMLYAVLHTLARERKGGSCCPSSIVVQGVEPQRVARYWMKMMPELVEKAKKKDKKSRKKKKNRLNSTETKKAKIDVVGGWLSAWRDAAAAAAATGSEQQSSALKVDIGSDATTREVVDAYLRKWEGKKEKKNNNNNKKNKSKTKDEEASAAAADIAKVDDLADCLLQGVTWLDWQAMRGRIARDGPDAVQELLRTVDNNENENEMMEEKEEA